MFCKECGTELEVAMFNGIFYYLCECKEVEIKDEEVEGMLFYENTEDMSLLQEEDNGWD